MEQNVIDLQKIEEETKVKIAAVNSQKVALVAAFITQMKVWINDLGTKDLNMTALHLMYFRAISVFIALELYLVAGIMSNVCLIN